MSTEMNLIRKMRFSKDHVSFGVAGDLGGVHFHTSLDDNGYRRCGLEQHSKTPPSKGEQPDNQKCWLIECPCYHDGSSLYAQERYLPLFDMCNQDGNFEPIWLKLEREYVQRFIEWGAA